MKSFGLILILLCSCLSGAMIKKQMNKRIVLLRKIQLFIEYIDTQIGFMNTDIISLLSSVNSNSNFGDLLFINECINNLSVTDSFEDAWIKSVKNFHSPLKAEDKRILCSFGSQLGKTDTDGQISNCRLHIQQLENQITEAEEHYKKYGNLYFKLGILSGILIVISLI